MKTLTVRREIRFPIFGFSKWVKADYDTPLAISALNSRALIFVEPPMLAQKGLPIRTHGRIELLFSPPPSNLLKGLKSKGRLAQDAAHIIYDNYLDAFGQFEALLMSSGGAEMLLSLGPQGINEFFDERSFPGHGVEWKVDGEEYRFFSVNIPQEKGLLPLYTSRQLVTPSKWKKMQGAADDSDVPSEELLELYKIRSKLGWNETRVAAIEASIVSETLLREYAYEILKIQGFSKTKIKRLKDEMTFNNLLNIVLPLSLKKAELRRMSNSIQAVDALRSIRNGLVHGSLTLAEIDQDNVDRGVDGAIKLVGFLRAKLQKK